MELFGDGKLIPREPSAENRKMAQDVAEMVSSFMAEGFSREEAVNMTIALCAAAMKNMQ